jgi:excisionase family DNA binding protein
MPKTIQGITLYTIPETAQELGVCVSTIRNYLRSGKLTGTRIGRPIFITDKDIKRLLK